MAESSKKFQAPKGTRDFYPADLAVRRHIENVWRQTSINHGFDEIDGPTFENLDLYTHKSGPGIVSELFQVMSGKDAEQLAAIRAGEPAPYALRPEFTPTLARMVAARAPELPRPIKWFAIPSHFRAESPQRGRLREFMQWNVDFIGDDSPRADAEVIATAVSALTELGLSARDVRVKFNDRWVMHRILEASLGDFRNELRVYDLLDKRLQMSKSEFDRQAKELMFYPFVFDEHVQFLQRVFSEEGWADTEIEGFSKEHISIDSKPIEDLRQELARLELLSSCDLDLSIVRGLAYYTGTVFEIHEASGAERAIAGGGRYDKLIESFGGPSLPACGFGMGDVVLANILKDKGLLKPAEEYLPRPDAFVFAANDEAAAKLPAIVADLRKHNLHIRNSYKTTRNVGKLLGDAGKARARYAVILGKELAEQPPRVALKNLDSGEQTEIALADLGGKLKSMDADRSNRHD